MCAEEENASPINEEPVVCEAPIEAVSPPEPPTPGPARGRRYICIAFEAGAILVAAYFIFVFIYITFSRVGYPFEIEWMEGGMVDHGVRIMRGEGLYIEPSLDFIPYLYPPLYPIVLALGYWIFGICLWWGRLVSIVSTLAACAVAFRWIQVETGRWRLGVIAVGLFLASFHACGSWFDVNRVDMLLLALLAGGMYLLRGEQSQRRVTGSAILLGLAFFAKQFALIFLVAGVVVALLRSRRAALIFSAVGFGIVAFFTGLLAVVTGGWSWYYCFTVPSQHGIDWQRVGSLWRGDVVHRFPFQLAGAVTGAFAWFFAADRLGIRRVPVILFAFLAGVTASFLGRVHFGGYDNTLIPMAFFTVIFLFIAAGKLAGSGRGTRRACAVVAALCVLALFQFYVHDYPISPQVPTGADRVAGEKFIEALRCTEGDVFIPFHSYYWSLAGKQMRFHIIALHDIITVKEYNEEGVARMVIKHELIPPDIAAAFEEQRFSAVIPNPGYYLNAIWPLLSRHYRLSRDFPALPSPNTGMGTRTGRLWLPRPAPLPRRR